MLGSCIEQCDDFMMLCTHSMSPVFTLLSWCGIFGLNIFQERSGQPLLAFLKDEFLLYIIFDPCNLGKLPFSTPLRSHIFLCCLFCSSGISNSNLFLQSSFLSFSLTRDPITAHDSSKFFGKVFFFFFYFVFILPCVWECWWYARLTTRVVFIL